MADVRARDGDVGVVEDDADVQAIADLEIPEVQREARAWLVANNTSDQRVVIGFALGLAILALVFQSWWTLVLAGAIVLHLPFRWAAGPHFRAGNVRQGILWANAGTWYLIFPVVLILPDALPIAIQNVIGPMILAAAYLERRLVRRLVPVTIVIAIVVSWIGLTTDGVGLDDQVPGWVYMPVLLAYVGANLWLVMSDLRESNVVRLRILQRAIRANRALSATDQALRESRRRLLVAADDERVRLERNLHDGAQQRLVSLSMQLRLAAELSDEGRPPTTESLYAMHVAANEAIDELRDLAQGVYPARLHEIGLARALHAVARRSPLRISITDSTTTEIDRRTQVALYFVCLEAIQNATKHGRPDTLITLSIEERDDELVVTVEDDGPGFDPEAHADSRGLLNMGDRVGALGGELQVDSSPGTGTRVVARLPIGSLAGAPT